MLLLCAGQAVRDFILDMAPDATDEQIKNDLITGYSDLQGLGCKQAAYDNIAQRPEEPVRSYIVRYSRLFKLLNGTVPNEVRMRTTSMHFVNSLRGYLSSKVENRLLGMNEEITPWATPSQWPYNASSRQLRQKDDIIKETPSP